MSTEVKISLTIKNTGDGFEALKAILKIISFQCLEETNERISWRKWITEIVADNWMIYKLWFEYDTFNEFKFSALISAESYTDFLHETYTLFPGLTVVASIISFDLNYQAAGGYAPDIPWHLDSETKFSENGGDAFELRKIPLSIEYIDFCKRFSRFPISHYVRKIKYPDSLTPPSEAEIEKLIEGMI